MPPVPAINDWPPARRFEPSRAAQPAERRDPLGIEAPPLEDVADAVAEVMSQWGERRVAGSDNTHASYTIPPDPCTPVERDDHTGHHHSPSFDPSPSHDSCSASYDSGSSYDGGSCDSGGGDCGGGGGSD